MKSQRACFAARQKSSKVVSLCSASIVARALSVSAVKRMKSSACSVARVVQFQRNGTEITVQFHCATRAEVAPFSSVVLLWCACMVAPSSSEIAM